LVTLYGINLVGNTEYINRAGVGKIEQGERRLDLVEYLRVCNALQIDPNEGLALVKKHLF